MEYDALTKYLATIIPGAEDLPILGKKKNYVLVSCPLATWTHKSGADNHPSMMIWFSEEEESYYKCYSCKEQGNLWRLFLAYGQKSGQPEMQALALEVLKADTPTMQSRFLRIGTKLLSKYDLTENPYEEGNFIPDKVINNFCPAWQHPHSQAYLISRKVDMLTSIRYNLQFDEGNTRIVFPVYNKDGRCVGAVGRTFPPGNEEKQRYYNYFNFQASESLGGVHFHNSYPYQKVLVLEGFFDILNCWSICASEGVLPVCTWKAAVSERQLTMLLGFDKILICGYDNGSEDKKDAGNVEAQKFIRKGAENGIVIKRLELPIGIDMGELPQEEISKRLNSLTSFKTLIGMN